MVLDTSTLVAVLFDAPERHELMRLTSFRIPGIYPAPSERRSRRSPG